MSTSELSQPPAASAPNGTAYPRMRSGIVFGIIAAMAFGTNPLFAKPLYACGFSVDSVLFFRFTPAVIIMGILSCVNGHGLKVTLKELFSCIVAGGLFCGTSLALFMSYREMDAGVAATLLFIYPVLVAMTTGLIFHEKIPAIIYVALFLSLAGVVFLCQSSADAKVGLTGILLALLGAVFYAFYLVWVARSKASRIPAEKLTFYALLTCLVFYFVRIKCGFALEGQFSLKACLNIVGLSLVSAALSLGCAAQALKRSGEMITSVLGALEPLTVVFLGWAIFDETITLKILFGIALILLAVILVACRPTTNAATHQK